MYEVLVEVDATYAILVVQAVPVIVDALALDDECRRLPLKRLGRLVETRLVWMGHAIGSL